MQQKQPYLFLMLGYPGAGKTTVAKLIAEILPATHVWADSERRKRFGTPQYSPQENTQLYEELNTSVDTLLNQHEHVVFDTAFNHYEDRQKLTAIAAKHGAKTVVIWVKTDRSLSLDRSTNHDASQDNRVLGTMGKDHFETLSAKLEPPHDNEIYAEIEGTGVTRERVAEMLSSVTNL